MNKLSALSKLASAYFYLYPDTDVHQDALNILSGKFHHVRRSMLLQDLAPTPKCTEGFNGRMPTQL